MRGRIRKFSIDNQITALIENAADEENVVRFALIEGSDPAKLTDFVLKLVPEATVSKVLGEVHNPVLSKLKVNDESRYDV